MTIVDMSPVDSLYRGTYANVYEYSEWVVNSMLTLLEATRYKLC